MADNRRTRWFTETPETLEVSFLEKLRREWAQPPSRLWRPKNYEEYVRIQTETNIAKLEDVWVTEKELRRVATYVKRRLPNAKFGICHGVRNGYEVHELRRLLGCDVIGTEISETANRYDNVIQWDFHEVKDEWLGRVDFIYSNSWDHSYDPDLMLQRWMSCLAPGGKCFLEWSRNHKPKSVYGADCFGIDYREFKKWITGRYVVENSIHLNRSSLRDLRTWPLTWVKNLILAVRVVVIRNKS